MLKASELSDDNVKLGKQVKDIDTNIDCRKYDDTKYHALYGYALAKLKFSYYTLCNICQSMNADMFTVLKEEETEDGSQQKVSS